MKSFGGNSGREVLVLCVLAVSLFAGDAPLVSAQVATSTIQGEVTDETKGVLPGVTVTVLNEETGVSRFVVTDERGWYRITALQPGRYALTAEVSGFSTITQSGINLTIGQEMTLPVRLGLVSVEERVTVTSQAPLIEITKTTLGSTFTAQKLEVLPMAGRNYLTLVTMATGVTPDGGAAGMATAAAGRNSGRVGYQVDGVSQENNLTLGSRGSLSPDSVQEFQVLTNMFGAEYGTASGPIVNILTRSGTNDLHGRFGVYARMNELDARDYFARGEAPFSQQWYSAYIGGPIQRNKLHYFGSFEGLREDQTAVVTSPLMPGEYPNETRNIKFLTKLDYQIGSSQHLTFRYNFDGGKEINAGVSGLNTIERGRISKPRRQDYQGSVTSVVTSSIVNEFRVQYAPLSSGNRDGQLGQNCPGCPAITRPGGNLGKATNQPQWFDETRLQIVDAVSMTQGRHDLKAGVNYSYLWTDIFFPNTSDGAFVFTTDRPFDAADAATYPVRYDIIVGDPLAQIPDQLLALFIQDSWRVRPNLTIHAGLRYDWQGQYIVRNDKNNFGPRLSFSYDPTNQGTFVIRGGGGTFYDRNRGELTLFAIQAERSFVRTQIVNPGYPDPLGPNPNGSREGTPPVPSLTVVDPNKVITTSHRASLGFMKALTPTTRVSSDLVLTKGLNVLRNRDINPVIGPGGRRQNPSFGVITQQEASARTHYLGLESELERQLNRNLQFTASYTLSWSRHDLDVPVSQLDFSESMARAGNRHVMNASIVYQLPANFQFGTLFRARSGNFYSVLTGRDDNGDSFFTDRPAGEDRNTHIGPWSWGFDARLSKYFNIGASRRIELIAEAFNVTNRPQFGDPENRLTSANFGRFVEMDDNYNPRRVQLGARFSF